MAITVDKIIEHIMETPSNSNPNVLKGMLEQLQGGDNPDLSHITATADKILVGYESVDKKGQKVEGSCTFNATIPDVSGATYAAAGDIAKGKQALILVNNVWTLVTGTKEQL